MKRLFKYIVLCFLLMIVGITNVSAKEKNLVNLYLFHSNTCVHCQHMRDLLKQLKDEYPNLKVRSYEISDSKNAQLYGEVGELYDVTVASVPFVVVGDKYFVGFNEVTTSNQLKEIIDYYSNNGYVDKVGEMLGNVELPSYEITTEENLDNDIKQDNEAYLIKLPLFGEINVKNLALPVMTIVLGLVDGFNPCAMWVLLFLISMLLGMKDKMRMWILGVSFLITSAIIYLGFMLAWLNVASFIGSITWIRLIIALVALVGGLFNLTSYFRSKEDGCDIVDDKKRSKMFARIKQLTSEKNLLLALLGVMFLAVSVNLVELACSAGIPVMFTSILSMNNLSGIEYMMYILLYILFFLVDDLVVFIIAMVTAKLTGFSTKFGKLSHLIGGILLILIGLLMAFKPEWLMLNFG
ncbi:MAG: hypothetical protein Q4G04_06000 [bacterium]|nr:hypothetical protein [bacterium]